MKIIGLNILDEAKRNYPEVKKQLDVWRDLMEDNTYKTPAALRNHYNSVDFLGKGNTIFNIKGNKYRLLVLIDFEKEIVMPKRFDPHSKYDRWKI